MDKLIANGSLALPNGVLLGVFLAESGLLWSTAATLGSKPEARNLKTCFPRWFSLVEFEVLGRWGCGFGAVGVCDLGV